MRLDNKSRMMGDYHVRFCERLGLKCPGLLNGNVTLAKNKFYATEHAIVVGMHKNVDVLWSYYLLDRMNLNQYSTGLAQPGLSVQNLLKLETFASPILQEQQKIASFLTTVDDKIRMLKQKKELLEEYKKGVMQQIFSRKLRFRDEDGEEFPEWEEKRMEEIFQRITTKNDENNENVLTISAQYGLINQLEFFDKSVAAVDISGYYLIEKGDFAYNKSYSKGYPMGAIKSLKRYNKGVVSTLYICFRIHNESDESFFEQYFESGFINRQIHKIAQEGARNHGLLNLSVIEFFKDIKVIKPSIKEQQKIASFLTALDDKIAAVGAQIEGMETWKNGLLQRMFV